jgi:hypothetical protein
MAKNLVKEVEETLTNSILIKFLQNKNKKNHGFIIGKINYFDDLCVEIRYGITLDEKDNSKIKIFSYKLVGKSTQYNFKLGEFLPHIPSFAKYPSQQEFKKSVDKILENPEKRFTNFDHFTRDY